MADYHFARRLSEQETKFWEERVTVSRQMLRRMEARWDEAIKRYANRHLPQIVEGDGPNVSVNVILSNVRTKLPFLFYQDPELTVRPNRPKAPPDLGPLAVGLNYHYLRLNNARDKINRAILDGLLQSRGILKIGYSTRTVYTEEQPKKGGDPKKPFFGKKRRGRPRKESSAVDQMPPLRIAQEGPTLTHVSPRRFFTHPDAKFPIDEHARWVCHMSVQPLEMVRIDDRFDESWRRDVKGTEHLAEKHFESLPDFGADERDRDPANEFVVLYEVWEKTRREVLVFAEGNFKLGPARVTQWPFVGMRGFPFVMYVPLEIPETFESMTELDPILNQVEEMDHFRTMQARHLSRFKRFYEITSDTVDHDELDKLRIREDGDFLISNRDDGQPAIHIVPDANVPLDAFRFIADIKNDINEGSGVSNLKRQGESGAETATEASIIDQAQQARSTFDRQVVDDFVLSMIEKQFAVMQQWLPKNLAIRVMGPLGEDWVERVSPDMIEGEFDFSIIPGSTQPPNTQLLRAEVSNLVGMLSNPMFEGQFDPKELLRMILETFPELIRGGRLQKILRAPEAVQGPLQPESLGLPGNGGAPGGEVSPEVQQLLASLGGGGV